MSEPVIFGYARISSTSQCLSRQIDVLRAYGIDDRHLMLEKQSGKDFNRPVFLSLVGTDTTAPIMREGDCLVVTSLDRLGRNYTEILQKSSWMMVLQKKLTWEKMSLFGTKEFYSANMEQSKTKTQKQKNYLLKQKNYLLKQKNCLLIF